MTQDYVSAESILAVDCGSTTTQALLIDQVNGDYRLLARTEAPSTVEPPWNDVAASVRHALAKMTEVTGWPLLNDRGQIMSPQHQLGGVDAVVVVSSASSPLCLVLAGVMSDFSLVSARRALATTYAIVEGIISLDRRGENRHSANNDFQGQIELIQRLKPDAVVIVGGIDGGASRPVLQAAEALAIANFAMPQSERPQLIYAGNVELRSQIAEVVGGEAELRAVDNVRPDLQLENPGPLQTEIEALYRQQKMERDRCCAPKRGRGMSVR